MSALEICLVIEAVCLLVGVWLARLAYKDGEKMFTGVFIAYSLWVVVLMVWEVMTK